MSPNIFPHKFFPNNSWPKIHTRKFFNIEWMQKISPKTGQHFALFNENRQTHNPPHKKHLDSQKLGEMLSFVLQNHFCIHSMLKIFGESVGKFWKIYVDKFWWDFLMICQNVCEEYSSWLVWQTGENAGLCWGGSIYLGHAWVQNVCHLDFPVCLCEPGEMLPKVPRNSWMLVFLCAKATEVLLPLGLVVKPLAMLL